SAHRYGAMDPLFQTVQNLMAKENGSESTRYCGGCHDPISLFSGEKMAGETPLSSEMGVAEGVSCLVCHAMTQVDVRGNADYVIAEPPRFMFDPPVSTAGQVTRDFLIRSLGGVHRSSMGHKLLQTPEFCGACHKQFVDVEINKVGWVQLQNQYDNWKASRWYHQDEPKKRLACRDCHMPVQHNSTDPAAAYATDSREKGAHRSHRSLGANQFVPLLLGLEDAQKHTDLIELWLQGKIPVPEIEERWVPGPVVGMTSQLADSVVSVRDSIRVHLTMTNRKAGHPLPTGPLDLIRAWVRLKLIDENGRVVLQTGDPTAEGGDADPKVMFKAEPVNNQGEVLERHNLWDLVGVRFKRALFPGLQDFATMAVPCPVTVIDDPGALTNPIKALSAPRPGVYKVVTEFCYHKAQPRILNAILGPGHGLVAPETIMVSDTTQVRVTS
ncbi:MAG: hypothetical protein QGH20_06205, partial [Candidatus Latescibacteria bacterium]|nr:hypothetical protein [Candidatus Latescibacterota bacterium]